MALRMDEVREIIELPKDLLCPLGMPRFVRGMLNLRGQMVTLIDVRTLYGSQNESDSLTSKKASKVVISQNKDLKFGLIVDSVEDIVSFSEESVLKLPDVLYKGESDNHISKDIKCLVEVEIGHSKKALWILNLENFSGRLGLSYQAA